MSSLLCTHTHFSIYCMNEYEQLISDAVTAPYLSIPTAYG